MTKALEHFLPNIDLNLHSLKEVVRSINAPDGQPMAMSDAGDSINVQTVPGIQPKTEGAIATGASSVTIEEIDALHGELGWLRVDSKGTYRKLRSAAAPFDAVFSLVGRTCRSRLGIRFQCRCQVHQTAPHVGSLQERSCGAHDGGAPATP